MKYIYQIIVSVCLGCMALSCEAEVEYGLAYGFCNQSGHTISVVHNPSADGIVDSLVLKVGETYYMNGDSNYFNEKHGSRKIYYDGRYLINFSDLPDDRKIEEFNFTALVPPPYYMLYTFIESDYDYAVAHGTDLGEPQPAL